MINRRLSKVLVPGVLLILGLVLSNPASAATYTIFPEADSYVDSQEPGANYGSDVQLYTTYFPDYLGSPKTQRAFLKFDLSGIPKGYTITAANLYLFVTTNSGHPPAPTANLYQVGNGWTETGITWNNQPAAGSYLAAQGYMFWGSYYPWNLFESGLLKPNPDLAAGRLSLLLRMSDEATATEFGYTFNSRKHDTNRPYLEITANPAPDAVNILLLNDSD